MFSSYPVFIGFISYSMTSIKFFKIPCFFQVFQVYSHISGFSRSSGNPVIFHVELRNFEKHVDTIRVKIITFTFAQHQQKPYSEH